MKPFKFFTIISVAICCLLLQSCPESSSPVEDKGVVQQFTSTSGGALKTDNGAEIIIPTGAIGKKENGESGVVSISIEPSVKESDLPTPIPIKYQKIGNIYAFGPSGFIFAEPVQIYLPANELTSPEGVLILWYNEMLAEWVPSPISDIDADNKRLGTSVFELGYFVLAREGASGMISKNDNPQYTPKSGGIMYRPSETNYYYTITVTAATLDDPQQSWPGLIGWNGSTGSYPTGGPLPYTRLHGLPPGNYTVVVSRSLRGTLFQPPGPRLTYTNPTFIRVNAFTNTSSWDWNNWSTWSNLTLSGGEWREGNPATWPQPTKPYGTGEFQATLNWVNTSQSATDLDLHLFGPNNMQVNWSKDQSSDGSIKLDRDWQSEKGSAVENIFSVAKMPAGDYSVYVNLFLGDKPKPFEVRIIRQGSVVKTIRATATQGNSGEEKSKMILIQTFKIN